MNRTLIFRSLYAISCFFGLLNSQSHAGNTWDGGAGTGNWNDGNNWDVNGVPGTGALTFTGDIQTITNNDRTAALSYSGINFTNDGLTGKTSAFTLNGNSITLNGNITTTANTAGSTINDVINLAMIMNADRTITTNQQSDAVQHNLTIGGLLSESGGARRLTKQGSGTLTLNGSVSNTFSNLTVNGGTLVLDYSNMGTATNLVASTIAPTIKGANLILKGKATGATTQTLGNVTMQQGGSSILIDPNGGTSTTLTLGTFDSATSGVSMLVGKVQGAGSGTVTITTTTNKAATDIYRSRFVFSDGTSTGYDWVTTSSVSSPYALEAYSGYSALDTTAGTDTLNSRINGSATLSGNRTTNTLKIETPAASQSLDLAGNTLTLTGSGFLVTGTNAFQITGSSGNKLTAGNGAGSYDLIIHQYNSGGLDIGAVIGNNGANGVTLVKGGTGSLTLSGSNTFTGGVYINSGELIMANAGALNSTAGSESAVTFTTGSTLTLNGNSVTVRSLNSTNTTDVNGSVIQNANAGAATLTVGNSNAQNGTFAGIIQDGAGGGTLALIKNGTGTLTLMGDNTFSGGITLNAGALSVSRDANLGDAFNTITVNGNATFSGGSTTYARSFILNGSTLNIGNETATITGNVSGTGGLTIGAGGGFSAGAIFNGTNNTFEGGIAIGGTGTGNVNYRASFASLADSSTANGNISLVGNGIAGTAIGSAFEYTGATDLTLNNRAIVLASTGAQPGHTGGNPGGGHQIRQNGTGTLTINTDLSVTSSYAQTLSLRGSGNGVFAGDISNNGSASSGTTALGTAFSAAATSITLGSVDGVTVGASISGTGIAGGTTITGINTLTRAVTLSAATTGAGAVNQVMTIAGVQNYVSLTKHDAGVWTLSGTNTYSGATTVNGGILTFANKAAKSSNSTVTALSTGAIGLGVGAGGVTDYSDTDVASLFNDGQLGGATGINLAATSGFAIDTTAGNFTQTTGLTATRALTKLGGNILTLTGANSYNGATTVSKGTLQFSTQASLYNNTTGSWTANNLRVANGGTLAFNVGGTNEFTAGNVNTLLTNLAASTSATSGMNAGSNLGFDTTNASGGTFTIANVIADTTGTFGGARGLTKLGTGTLILSNDNTYTGASIVTAGTLRVHGSTAAGSNFTVQSGATLGGSGSIGGTVILNSGATLAPGASIESLATGSNVWSGGSTYEFEFSTNGSTGAAGTEWDLLSITGTLDLTGASSSNQITFDLVSMLNATDAGSLAIWDPNANATWAGIVTTTGGINGFATNLFAFDTSGFQNTINGTFNITQNGNNLDLNYVIPEPKVALLGAIGILLLLRRRR